MNRIPQSSPPPVDRRSRGRPTHVPTDESRSKVRRLALVPIVPARIAAALGISEPTLYKYYGEILRLALTQTIAQVVAALYQNGLEGDAEAADFFLINVEGYKKPDIVVEHVLDWLDGEMVRAYPGNSRRPREASRPNPSIPKIRVPHSWLNKKGELASKLRRRKGQGRA